VEDCTNGIDDDGDGAIDCADPDCQVLFQCAPAVPPGGWVGPLSLWQGTGTETPPDCGDSGGFPTEVGAGGVGLTGADPSCPACSCNAPIGVSCAIGSATFFAAASCVTQGGTLNVPANICQPFVTLSFDPASVRWATAPASGGACIPKQTGNPSIPPAQWATQMLACGDGATAGAGCGAGVCVPRPAPPFDDALCVYQAGDVPCPPGPYSLRTLFYTTAGDTRDCSACDCGAPTGTTCAGTVKLYTDTACSVEEVILSSVSQCAALPPDTTTPPPPYLSQRSMIYQGAPTGSGSCASIPSKGSGTVAEEDPLTVCCTP
jgi:hypothetical protein